MFRHFFRKKAIIRPRYIYPASIVLMTSLVIDPLSVSQKKDLSTNHRQVIILGSGPAGLTAALYTARANLKPLVLEGNEAGGQLITTTEVENFPGFVDAILGPDLVDNIRKQASRFGAEYQAEHVDSVDFKQQPFTLKTNKNTYTADTVIVATGASAIYLGLKGEQELIGRGISACATCDGFFFKDKEVAVVGGGDTAMEEAIFLTRFAKKVYVIHRRNELRASKILQERAFKNPKIEFIWDTIVMDIVPTRDEKSLSGLIIQNKNTNKATTLPVKGLFVAIGHRPNTEPFKGQLELDDHGYIVVEKGTSKTNVVGVFACGDVQDSRYRQAITAAGTGCMAAMDAEKYLDFSSSSSSSSLQHPSHL